MAAEEIDYPDDHGIWLIKYLAVVPRTSSFGRTARRHAPAPPHHTMLQPAIKQTAQPRSWLDSVQEQQATKMAVRGPWVYLLFLVVSGAWSEPSSRSSAIAKVEAWKQRGWFAAFLS